MMSDDDDGLNNISDDSDLTLSSFSSSLGCQLPAAVAKRSHRAASCHSRQSEQRSSSDV